MSEAYSEDLITETEAEPSTQQASREWLNFGLLAVVLMVVVVVIALLRPFIFGKIVPAVLGDGESTPALETDDAYPADELEEADAPIDEVMPTLEETEENSVTVETEAGDDVAERADGGKPEENESITAEIPPESNEALPPSIEYTIQAGDTLQSIAANHRVSMNALIELNKIANPDRIQVGAILHIPQPGIEE